MHNIEPTANKLRHLKQTTFCWPFSSWRATATPPTSTTTLTKFQNCLFGLKALQCKNQTECSVFINGFYNNETIAVLMKETQLNTLERSGSHNVQKVKTNSIFWHFQRWGFWCEVHIVTFQCLLLFYKLKDCHWDLDRRYPDGSLAVKRVWQKRKSKASYFCFSTEFKRQKKLSGRDFLVFLDSKQTTLRVLLVIFDFFFIFF